MNHSGLWRRSVIETAIGLTRSFRWYRVPARHVLYGTGVAARSFTDLDAWKLANELKLEIYGLIRTTNARRDSEFLGQIRNSAASAPRNIAEGFGRYVPREFSQYLRIANGSLMETSNHLQDGVDRGYFSEEQIQPLQILARRASAAASALIRYLQTTAGRANAKNPSTRTGNTRAPGHPSTLLLDSAQDEALQVVRLRHAHQHGMIATLHAFLHDGERRVAVN